MNADDQKLLDWAELSLTGKDHVTTVWRWKTNPLDLLAIVDSEVVDGKFKDRHNAIVFTTDDRLFPRVCWEDMFKYFRPCALAWAEEPGAYQVACTKNHDTIIHQDHIETVAMGEYRGTFVCARCGEDIAPVIRKIHEAKRKVKELQCRKDTAKASA